MVAILPARETVRWEQGGQTYAVTFDPEDLQGSIRKLVSLAESKQLTWATVAALRVCMIKVVSPGLTQVSHPKVLLKRKS